SIPFQLTASLPIAVRRFPNPIEPAVPFHLGRTQIPPQLFRRRGPAQHYVGPRLCKHRRQSERVERATPPRRLRFQHPPSRRETCFCVPRREPSVRQRFFDNHTHSRIVRFGQRFAGRRFQ